LWLDASDTSSITKTGSAVDQINDKSGSANHFTGTTTTRPASGTTTLNGLNVLYFVAANGEELLGPVLSTLTDNFSMFAVFDPLTLPTANMAPFANGDGSGYAIALRTSGANTGYLRGGIAWHNGSIAPSADPQLLSMIRTSGTWDMRVNGASSVGGTSAPNTPATRSRIGSHAPSGAGVAFLNGAFAEALFYTAALNDTDRDAVTSYLNTKWAIY